MKLWHKQLLALCIVVCADGSHARSRFHPTFWVQDNFIAAPKAASLAGAYSGFDLAAESLAFGNVAVPFPLELPDARGSILHNFLPSYSHRAGWSEWGRGWQSSLTIHRIADIGEIDCKGNLFASPWGRLAPSSIENVYYPQGFEQDVRVVRTKDQFVAYLPGGRVFRFRKANALSWNLVEAEDREGHKTSFVYQSNSLGRSYLSKVRYGGKRTPQYEVNVNYESLSNPLKRFESCGLETTIDRRVRDIVVKHWDGKEFSVAKTLCLEHDSQLYLTKIGTEFRTGEALPEIRYQYGRIEEVLAKPYNQSSNKFYDLTIGMRNKRFFSKSMTWVDLNQDGVVDIERGSDLKSYVQSGGGEFRAYADHYGKNRDKRCPPLATYDEVRDYFNPRRLLIRPAGLDDNLFQLLLENDRDERGTRTTILVCSLDGQVAYEKEVFSVLQSGMSLDDSAHLVDINGDLKPDLVRIGYEQYSTIINKSIKGAIKFADKVTRPLPKANKRFASNYVFTDINGDGFADLTAQVRGGLYVWYGKGDQVIGPEPVHFPFESALGNPVNLKGMEATFVDINRDGLMDIVARYRSHLVLWINRGDKFVEQDFPGFDPVRRTAGSTRVINLVGGGNEQITIMDLHRGLIYFDLNVPSTSLLTRVDNGQGSSLRIEYTWTQPCEGVPQLMIVPKSLTRSIAGLPDQVTNFTFANPRVDLKNGHLLGFERVESKDATMSAVSEFKPSLLYSPKILKTTKKDLRVHELAEVETHDWLEEVLDGIAYPKLLKSAKYFMSKGSEVLAESTSFENYDRLCPKKILKGTKSGMLERQVRYDELRGCVARQEMLSGRHDNQPAFDFVHGYHVKRNGAGLPTSLDLLSSSGRLPKIKLAYDASSNLERVTQANGDTTRIQCDPIFEIPSSLTRADGSVLAIAGFDPNADSITSLVTKRVQGEALTQSFAYDGFNRLQKTWSNLVATARHYAYRFANQTAPAVVSDSQAHTVTLESGDGSPLIEARAGAGYYYGRLARKLASKGKEQEVDASKLAKNPLDITFALLAGEKRVLSETEVSGLWGVLARQLVISDGKQNYVTRQVEVDSRELKATVVENRQHRVQTTPSYYVDELGQRTQYNRDALDRLREIVLPSGEVHQVDYDGFGRKQRVFRSKIGGVLFAYDNAADRIQKKTFYGAQNQTLREEGFEYDFAGRVSAQTRIAWGKSVRYDLGYDGKYLSTVRHNQFSKDFKYAQDGAPTKKSFSDKSGTSIDIALTYDQDRNWVAQTIAAKSSGRKLPAYVKRFTYDAYRRLQAVQIGDVAFSLTHNQVGKIAQIKLPDGGEFEVACDPVTHGRAGYLVRSPRAGTSYQYRFNDRGLVDNVNIRFGNTSLDYAFEYAANKVLAGEYSKSSPGYPYPIPRPEGVYDENRHLIIKYREGKFAFARFENVVVDTNHVYEKLTIEGIDLGILIDGKFQAVLFDHVGSVIAAGDFVSIPTPFGERTNCYALQAYFDFAGCGRDEHTGLISMGERDYDPVRRQFTSPDQVFLESPEACVGSPLDCDLYSYARNNPLLYTDPTGRTPDLVLDIPCLVIGAIDLYRDPSAVNAVALGLDVASAVLPGVTGLGRLFKGALPQHLRQLEEYGTAGYKNLQNGHVRYYGPLKNPNKPGEMAGIRKVRDWDPITGNKRTWLETIDHSGRVRQVRPQTGDTKTHFVFERDGKYVGTR